MRSLFRIHWVTDPALSIAPPLRLSNSLWSHNSSFLPSSKTCFYLQVISCHLWSTSSAQLYTRAEGRVTGRASHCHVLSIPVLSIHKVKLLQKPLHRAAIVPRGGWDTKCSFMCTANKQPRASNQHPGSFWVFCKQFVERWHFNKLHLFSKASVLS